MDAPDTALFQLFPECYAVNCPIDILQMKKEGSV